MIYTHHNDQLSKLVSNTSITAQLICKEVFQDGNGFSQGEERPEDIVHDDHSALSG